MECDVVDARPYPEILWHFNDDTTPIAEVTNQNSILYLEGGRYLLIRQLTAQQRMGRFHCEVVNAFLSFTAVRAPTTYLLSGSIFMNTLTLYKPVEQITATVGETVTYVFPVAVRSGSGTALTIALSCSSFPGGITRVVNDIVVIVSGFSAARREPLSIVCQIMGTGITPQPQLELSFFVRRK